MRQQIQKLTRGLRSVGLLTGFLSLGVFAAACNSGEPAGGSEPLESVRASRQALAGIDGSRTISSAGTIVNQYTTLAANAALNATTIQVTSVAALTSGTDAIAPGDLVLIMQMQGATIDTTSTNQNWGQVTALGGAGLYEFAEVVAVNTGTNVLTLSCALKNQYTTGGQTQVIRVPQYDTLTVAAGGTITAPAWDGSVGGVVAVHAKTSIALNGDVVVTGLGFRGGVAENNSASSATDTNLYVSTNSADGGRKGEGIAGLLSTQFGRAPAANGGGGGNAHNAGGGGGANARRGSTWTGQGVFNLGVTGGTAWLLDPGYSALDTLGSEGGGRGGYSYSGNNLDALTVGPNQATWGGNQRRERGGLGGHPLDNDPATRIFMGGGGGAGDGNDGHSGSGGPGGGIAILLAPSVTGTGRILANGQSGVDANSQAGGAANGDSPGGGGGGGTVIVRGTTLTGFTVQASGGAGGNQLLNNGQEAEGPGGGGGGGFVSVNGTVTATVDGGLGGTTNSPALTEFPNNGATRGNTGQALLGAQAVGAVPYCVDSTAPDTTIATHPSVATTDTTGDFTFTSNDAAATFECRIDGAAFAACAATYATPVLADGSHTLDVRAKDLVGNVDATPATFTWTVDTTAPDTTIATKPPATTNDNTGDFTFTSNESNVTFECRVDGAAFAACSATFATAALLDGAHTLDVRARDAAGNVDATPATYTWTVDTTAPDTTIATKPPAASNDPTGDFTFTSNDVSATFECRVDGAAFAACSATFATAPLADGAHTLDVRARDGAGNVDASPATYTWTLNSSTPGTNIDTNPPLTSNDPTGDFTFSSNDPSATFECSLDAGAFAACPATYATPALSDGSHTLSVRAKNTLGTVDATPATYTWTVNTSAPDTTIVTKPPALSTDNTGDFTFSSGDATATFECRVDAGAFTLCASPFATPTLSDGQHTFEVRAKNTLGTVDPSPATYVWTVDATPPDTTILTKPSTTTTDATADFTFGSEPGATFECSIDAGPYAACPDTFATTPLALGAHSISVRAKDTAGNVDATPATATWTLAAPTVDTDGDGLSDGDEGAIGTNPNDADSDDDGVLDGSEVDPGKDTDGDGFVNALDPDSDNDGILDGTEMGVATAPPATDVTRGHFVPDADPATKTNPLDPDTDHGGVRDGSEDTNHNGKIDAGELDPNDAADDVATPPVDTDGDGLSDDEERKIGTNPLDADSDDDGLLDGAEPDPTLDSDGDGLINSLDPDSDDDGLFDGTELGKDCSNKDTAVLRRLCVADADKGATVTSPLNPDTDGGGVSDGSEDLDLNGAIGAGETDPTATHGADDAGVVDSDGDGLSDGTERTLGSNPDDADTDDDGLLDGDEPNPSADGDGDGLIDVLDVDSDDDGLFDGTETGHDCNAPATVAALGHCRADADPSTHTSAVNPDTDGGGVKDGSEDFNRDGKVDAGETNPTASHGPDDAAMVDGDGDGLSDGTEGSLGSDPNDADTDDDGLLDGEEPNPSDDRDGDGLIDVLDSDSDGDRLFDGTEAGRGCSNAATDVTKNQCLTDADLGKTTTFVLVADTDGGGVADGVEDANRNGRVDDGERDPLIAADDMPGSEGGAGGAAGAAGGGGAGEAGEAGAAPLGGSGGSGGSGATGGTSMSGGSAGTSGGAMSGGTMNGGSSGSPSGAGVAGDDHVVILGGGLCSYQPARVATNGAWILAAMVSASALRRRRNRRSR